MRVEGYATKPLPRMFRNPLMRRVYRIRDGDEIYLVVVQVLVDVINLEVFDRRVVSKSRAAELLGFRFGRKPTCNIGALVTGAEYSISTRGQRAEVAIYPQVSRQQEHRVTVECQGSTVVVIASPDLELVSSR